MVDLNEKAELSWLLNLKLSPLYEIAQALQQTKLKMNGKGARAQSAVAIEFRVTCAMPTPEVNLLIDKPFYLWIEREGATAPIFAGYIDQQYWKNPGTLDMN